MSFMMYKTVSHIINPIPLPFTQFMLTIGASFDNLAVNIDPDVTVTRNIGNAMIPGAHVVKVLALV